MPDGRNYLLGRGENLTITIPPPGGGGPKSHPYSFEEAKAAIAPKAAATSRMLDELPLVACPGDQAVAVLTLHPAYLAKSYSPVGLLAAVGLRPVGSRAATIVPRKPMKLDPEGSRYTTTELFVAGSRQRFRAFAGEITGWAETNDEAGDLIKIEDFREPNVEERIRPLRSDASEPLMEVALHGAGMPVDLVLEGFRHFLAAIGIRVDLDRRLVAGTLHFLPVRVPRELIPAVARFSFLRMAREMPSLRLLHPSSEKIVFSGPSSFPCRLPVEGPLSPDVRVAVFDGGMPEAPDLSRWVRRFDAPGVGAAVPEFLDHGLAVTSSLLFGPLDEAHDPQLPFTHVDHYRVLDAEAMGDRQGQLYPVLGRISNILKTSRPEYFVICVGPDQPVEDDIVDPWTILIDQHLARGDALAAVAAGNGGEGDPVMGLNRIQPPADCVNAFSVGASDSPTLPWARAPYSSVGPGRSPGWAKPDGLGFGGVREDPYMVLGCGDLPHAVPTLGTSLAAPTVLRAGLGIRAHLGTALGPLAIKALLTHRSDMHLERHAYEEYGWGRVRSDIEGMLTCDDDTVHVVYQGMLRPREYVRSKIPVPPGKIPGEVHLAITICTASVTDPEHPPNYTRSGLDVRFRPHSEKFTERKDGRTGEAVRSKSPRTRKWEFIGAGPYMSESELRDVAQKWETTRSGFTTIRGKSVLDPVIELHHNPRIGGANAAAADPIPYAMIVTVRAPLVKDLYDRVFRRYKGTLEPLVPVIDIDIPLRA